MIFGVWLFSSPRNSLQKNLGDIVVIKTHFGTQLYGVRADCGRVSIYTKITAIKDWINEQLALLQDDALGTQHKPNELDGINEKPALLQDDAPGTQPKPYK